MEHIIKLIIISTVILSTSIVKARYTSSSFASDSIRYAIFKNDCYVLNENNEKITNLVIDRKIQPNDCFVLCDKLIVKSESEIDSIYKIIINMDYIDDIAFLANDKILTYSGIDHAYITDWINLKAQEMDEYNIVLKVGNTNINEEIKISILIEQKD